MRTDGKINVGIWFDQNTMGAEKQGAKTFELMDDMSEAVRPIKNITLEIERKLPAQVA